MCCSAAGACLRRDDKWQSAAETGDWGYYCEEQAAGSGAEPGGFALRAGASVIVVNLAPR